MLGSLAFAKELFIFGLVLKSVSPGILFFQKRCKEKKIALHFMKILEI
jgi:hypothetical protein